MLTNLMSEPLLPKWTFYAPRDEVRPSHDVIALGEDHALRIASRGHSGTFGVWRFQGIEVAEAKRYLISAEYSVEGGANELVNVYALATWTDKAGKLVQRDYIDGLDNGEQGWRRLYRTITAPDGAAFLTIELALRWVQAGAVLWRRAGVQEEALLPERTVRVATTYGRPTNDFAKNLQLIMQMLDKAGSQNPDIICMTETIYEGSVQLPIEQLCQPIPGELTGAVSAKAKQYNSYVLFSMYERDGGHIYNTAVLIGRDGAVAAKYRKMHLPLYEAEMGVTPGDEYVVHDTDFGRIGILVCYDQVFPEPARILSLKGAEIIFIPTIGDEPLQSRTRARDNGVYVVVAGREGVTTSRIIDPKGELIGHTRDEIDAFTAEIKLDRQYYTHWLSVGDGKGESRSLYKKERRTDTYTANAI